MLAQHELAAIDIGHIAAFNQQNDTFGVKMWPQLKKPPQIYHLSWFRLDFCVSENINSTAQLKWTIALHFLFLTIKSVFRWIKKISNFLQPAKGDDWNVSCLCLWHGAGQAVHCWVKTDKNTHPPSQCPKPRLVCVATLKVQKYTKPELKVTLRRQRNALRIAVILDY